MFSTNGLMILLVASPWFYYQYYDIPPKTGFYCNDETLAHPYKPSTIASNTAMLIGFLVPLITICIVELIMLPYLKSSKLYITVRISNKN